MTHTIRIALAAAVGLSFLAEPALAAPGANHESALEKAPKAKDDKGGKKGGKKGKKDKKQFVGPIKKDDYPAEIRLRPLTISKGMAEVELGLDYYSTPNSFGGVAIETPDPITAGLDVEYGLAPTVSAHIGTGLLLSPDFQSTKTVTLGAKYLAYDSKDFDLAAGLDLSLGLYDNGPMAVSVIVPMRYLVGDQFDIHGSVNAPIYLSPDFLILIGVSPGVGFQASEQVYFSLDTTVLTIGTESGTTTHLGDILPINLSATYAIDEQWDVGAHVLAPDLLHTDLFGVAFGIFGRGRF